MNESGFERVYIRLDRREAVQRLKAVLGPPVYHALLDRLVREGLDKAINMLEASEAEKLANPQEQREV